MHVCRRFKPIRANFVTYLPHTAYCFYVFCFFTLSLLLICCCFSLFLPLFIFFRLSLPPPPCQGTHSIKCCFFSSFFPTWLHHPFHVHCSSVFSTTASWLSQYEISQLMSLGFTVIIGLLLFFCFIIIGKLITVYCKFDVSLMADNLIQLYTVHSKCAFQ